MRTSADTEELFASFRSPRLVRHGRTDLTEIVRRPSFRCALPAHATPTILWPWRGSCTLRTALSYGCGRGPRNGRGRQTGTSADMGASEELKGPNRRLETWKEIGSFLSRDAR